MNEFKSKVTSAHVAGPEDERWTLEGGAVMTAAGMRARDDAAFEAVFAARRNSPSPFR